MQLKKISTDEGGEPEELETPLDARAPRMILTVHDELVIESPEEAATQVVERVRDAMKIRYR